MDSAHNFVPKTRIMSSVDKNSYFLWILTPVAASFSVIIVIAALAGPIWLITEEKLITSTFKMDLGGSTMSKCTKSSLWIICSAILTNSTNCTAQSIQDVDTYNCMKIDYFPKEEYRADAHDSTSAIPYTIIKSCPFFLASGAILVTSFVVYLIPTIIHQKNLYYFAAGILFVVSGLLMLIGLIVYISIFKSEIGSKLRSKSAFEPPIFKFAYGQSFFLYVFGFISTEFVGVLNIFLYISVLQIKNDQEKMSCLPSISFHSKEKRPVKTSQKLDEQFICKRHAIPINLLFDSELGKRYYFEKINKMDDNSQNLAKSLNQLYTEPAPTFSKFDLSLYHEPPLTRSVSTTTEIFSENNRRGSKKNNETESKDHLNDICGLSSEITRGIRKTKDDLINEFFKRTGVKPKPKNIYFINNSGENFDENIFVVDRYGKSKKKLFRELPRGYSNSSLKNQYEKFHTKSLISLNRHDTTDLDNFDDHYFTRNKLYNDALYQSRTLPRSFMKRNVNGNQRCASPIQNSLHLQAKYPFSMSTNQFYKSCDDVNSFDNQKKFINNGLTIQWPQAISVSPNYSIKSSKFYNTASSRSEKDFHKMSSSFGDQKIQKKIAPHFENNNYQISNLRTNESFDLDQIEKDCRISHASLFKEGFYDIINGTAV